MGAFEKLCNEYRENKRLIEELEAMNDSIKADILAIMGDREMVTEGAAKATYKAVTSSRFDSSGFRKMYPDLFTEYSTPTTYRRFTVQ
jgi:predicted phage-related endonuclease